MEIDSGHGGKRPERTGSADPNDASNQQRKALRDRRKSQPAGRVAGGGAQDLIGCLETEWPSLAAGAVRNRLLIWSQQEPALAGFATPHQLLRHLLNRQSRQPPKDDVLAALVRQARTDPLAARLMLQALLPGLKALAGRLLLEADERDDVWSALLAHCWERIRCYPLERRPSRIAANVLLDTLQKTTRELTRQRRTRNQLANDRPSELATPRRHADIEQLLGHAVAAAAITDQEAELILHTRVDGADLHQLARDAEITYHTLNTRRVRAEKRLLLFLGYGPVTFRGSKAPFSTARVVGAGLTGSAGRGAATHLNRRR